MAGAAAWVTTRTRRLTLLLVNVLVLEIVGTATPFDWRVGLRILVVPPFAEPIFTLVVDEAAAPVAKLTVFVVAAAVALPNKVAVRTVVGVPPIV